MQDEIGFEHTALRRPHRQGLADRGRDEVAPGVSATFFGALADAGVNIEMISTSEIRISVVVRDDDVDDAVRAVAHARSSWTARTEAVVYGGSGR